MRDFDLDIAILFFKRKSINLFDKTEDRECFVSECICFILEKLNNNACMNVSFASKQALRKFLKDQFNKPAKGDRREFIPVEYRVPSKSVRVFSEEDVYGIPSNPKDAEHLKGYWVSVCGSKLNFSIEELASLTGMSKAAIRTRKRRKTPIQIDICGYSVKMEFIDWD